MTKVEVNQNKITSHVLSSMPTSWMDTNRFKQTVRNAEQPFS